MTIQRLFALTGCVLFAVTGPASAQPQPPAAPVAPAPAPPPGAPPPTAPVPPPVPASPATGAPQLGVTEPARPSISLAEVVRTTIRTHPDIRGAEANLSQRKAELKAARGPFDPAFLAGARHTHDETPVLPSRRLYPEQRKLVSDITNLDVGAAWFTTWGTTVRPNVGLARVHTRYRDPLIVPGVFPPDAIQEANLGITLIQPLLRGAGTVGTASGIDAAKAGRDAGVHAVAFTAQQRAFTTVAGYFQLVAASDQVLLLRDSAKVAEKLLSETRALVEADQRPRTDLFQLEGNLASRLRSVREAENLELQALHALGDAMGLSADKAQPWRPVEALPRPRPAPQDRARLARHAQRTRRDVRAARDLVASNLALLSGAEFNTKPALDLSLSVGYRGAVDDDGVDAFFVSPGRNIPGINAGVGLNLELPVSNTAREAERDLRQAQVLQAKIAASDLERQIPIRVLSALDDVRMSAAQLEASRSAVEKYRQALASEHDRVKEGAGTVIDLVLTQDQLIRAELGQLGDHLRYAVALARLEFELGSMPAAEADVAGALARMFALEARRGGP
jgi:outer membrane protein TolC